MLRNLVWGMEVVNIKLLRVSYWLFKSWRVSIPEREGLLLAFLQSTAMQDTPGRFYYWKKKKCKKGSYGYLDENMNLSPKLILLRKVYENWLFTYFFFLSLLINWLSVCSTLKRRRKKFGGIKIAVSKHYITFLFFSNYKVSLQ